MKNLLVVSIWLPTTLFTLILCLFYVQINYYSQKNLTQKLNLQASILTDNKLQQNIKPSDLNSVLGASKTVFAAEDARPALIAHFLAKYNSPLLPYSQYMVDIADKYGLEYPLIPAMSMQESLGCKLIPADSHNCWGYGIYGDKVVKFESYEKAIDTVAKTLKEKYIQDSLTNPDLIMSRWTPSSNGTWSYAVNYFMQQIRQGL